MSSAGTDFIYTCIALHALVIVQLFFFVFFEVLMFVNNITSDVLIRYFLSYHLFLRMQFSRYIEMRAIKICVAFQLTVLSVIRNQNFFSNL